jgi:hypothetical protein
MRRFTASSLNVAGACLTYAAIGVLAFAGMLLPLPENSPAANAPHKSTRASNCRRGVVGQARVVVCNIRDEPALYEDALTLRGLPGYETSLVHRLKVLFATPTSPDQLDQLTGSVERGSFWRPLSLLPEYAGWEIFDAEARIALIVAAKREHSVVILSARGVHRFDDLVESVPPQRVDSFVQQVLAPGG